MLRHDLHVHSIRSLCGTMTLGEIVTAARRVGVRSLCITDHGLAMDVGEIWFHVLCKRVPREIDGVRIYKGIELNVLNDRGGVDMPMALVRHMDYIAVGLHPWTGLLADAGPTANTDALLTALHRHPFIDAVVHPTQRSHPLEFDRLLPYMAHHGIAFEVNETNLATGKSDLETTAQVLAQAVALGVPVVTNSDAHVAHELATDTHIQRAFDLVGLDAGLAVNADDVRLQEHLEARRQQRERRREEPED